MNLIQKLKTEQCDKLGKGRQTFLLMIHFTLQILSLKLLKMNGGSKFINFNVIKKNKKIYISS